jgi:hypothetical protein
MQTELNWILQYRMMPDRRMTVENKQLILGQHLVDDMMDTYKGSQLHIDI